VVADRQERALNPERLTLRRQSAVRGAPAFPVTRPRLAGRFRPEILAAIAAGGALGTPARYLLGKAVHVSPGTFPWAMFWINLSGSFALGVLLIAHGRADIAAAYVIGGLGGGLAAVYLGIALGRLWRGGGERP
jgi:fluoride ion exporter CrcB/FEX